MQNDFLICLICFLFLSIYSIRLIQYLKFYFGTYLAIKEIWFIILLCCQRSAYTFFKGTLIIHIK